MDLLAPLRAFDRFQRRHRAVAIPVAVLRNLSDQGAGNAAVVMAYWAFFSVFPLLLLFSTILGFVLQGHPSAQQSLVHSALKQFPIIGSDLKTLRGSGAGLSIGILGTLFSGLGVTVAAQNAFNHVYAVPHYKQPNFFVSRLRGLKFLAVAGLLQILSTVASGVVSGGLGGVWLKVAGIALSLLLDVVLFFVVFRFLVPKVVATAELWPGILLAAVGWEVLQSLGGVYVNHVVKGGGQTYGTFATVIGLIAWLYLGCRIVVFAAEINVVLTRRLWPRSIMDPPEPADRRARAALAKMEERDNKQTVEVSFHPPDTSKHTDLRRPPYAVAPEPQADEPARPVVTQIATPDLHTLTVAEVLDAIDKALGQVRASSKARQEAHAWLRAAHDALGKKSTAPTSADSGAEAPAGNDPAAGDDKAAAAVLADAAELALGLSPR